MELVGVADVVSDSRVRTAPIPGIPVYASLADRVPEMEGTRGL
ncbi:MAG: hypothetical protein ACE5GJ_08410 [Gemmatimonadota bacterium]